MFEFGSCEEATSKAVKAPTTTKWVDRVKKDDAGNEFVRCRLVARDFKPTREGPRDDLFAARPPLEAKRGVNEAWTWRNSFYRSEEEHARDAKRKTGSSCRRNSSRPGSTPS